MLYYYAKKNDGQAHTKSAHGSVYHLNMVKYILDQVCRLRLGLVLGDTNGIDYFMAPSQLFKRRSFGP